MDTGLNNTNTLHLALDDRYFEDVEWIIEATDEERFRIWQDYNKEHKWEQVSFGKSYTILNLEVKPVVKESKVYDAKKVKKETLPVLIEFSFAIVNGHKIAFCDSPSTLTHSGYIEAFLLTYFQRTHDSYTRWNHTDATNAHNCLNYLNTIDIKPRKTIYKPNSYEEKYFIFKKCKNEKRKEKVC